MVFGDFQFSPVVARTALKGIAPFTLRLATMEILDRTKNVSVFTCCSPTMVPFSLPSHDRTEQQPRSSKSIHIPQSHTNSLWSTNVLFLRFRNVHSVFAAMSMQGAIVKDICDKPLHLKHAIGSRFFQPDRKGEGLHKPVIIQHAMFLDNNNQQIVHRSHAAKLREVPYAPTRNGVFSPPPMSLSAIRAYFKPRGSGHLNNELFARRVRQNSGDTHSPLHLPPLSSRMPTRAGPSQYPMPRGPHPILDAKSNYAVSKNNGTSSVFITGDGKRLPRVMNPSWPRYPCPDPEPLPAFTFPAKKATNVQDSAQSAPLREVQNVDEGTSTVVRRPEQARPNVLHMPWMSYASSSNSDGYVADLEDAIV